MKKLLYVFDDKLDRQYLSKLKEIKERTQLFLCPILAESDTLEDIKQELSPVNIFDFHHAFSDKAFEIKESFVRFIHEQGEDLKSYFKAPFKHFSVWWFSLVAEKNTLKSNSFHNLVKLCVISDFIEQCNADEIWLDLDDHDLSAAIEDNYRSKKIVSVNKKNQSEVFIILKNIYGSTMFFLGAIIKTSYLRMTMKRVKPAGKYLFVTYFPLIDKEAFKSNMFINKYYEPLQNALNKKRMKYSWLAINTGIDGFNWKEAAKLGPTINSFGDNLSFHEQWLSVLDYIYALFACIFINIKFMLKLGFISRSMVFSSKKLNLWQIYKKEYYFSFMGRALLDGLLFYLAFKNALKQTDKKTIIAYYMENYAWEKALNIAAAEAGELRTIGIQHNTVPLLSLNHFESKEDLAGRDNIQNLPRSTYLACVGGIPLNIFRKQGWQDDELAILGGLRYKYLHDLLENTVEWGKRRKRIVVALTINPIESKEILYYVYNAFKDCQNEYEILVKNHYAGRRTSMLLSDLKISQGGMFQIVNTSFSELLPLTKILITGGSTSAVEGLAGQCAVIVPRLIGVVDTCPLSHVTNLVEYVESPEELRRKTEEIMGQNQAPYKYEEGKQFIADYFDVLNSDEEYLSRLENIVLKKGGN